ncbi:MAG TPA: hypothetical protein DCY91_21210, partial [Cyanobacteria bacterium UBA11370]|nr:hypothetical protein [Cyanobacteria bacterium UBA11370]
LFQSGNEEILINKKLNNVEIETFSEPSHEPGQPEKEVQVDYENYEDYGYPPEEDYYSDYSGDYSLEPEPFEQDYYPDENGGESPRQSKSVVDDKINDILVELMVPIIEAMPAVQPELKELQSESSFLDLAQASAQLQQEEETIKSSSLNSEPTQKSQLTPEILSSESPVEGKFSYDWQANAAGNVLIQDKQGNALLAVSQGHMRSRLTEKDFQHFEQMLPALQNSAGSSRQPLQTRVQPAASKGKQVER